MFSLVEGTLCIKYSAEVDEMATRRDRKDMTVGKFARKHNLPKDIFRRKNRKIRSDTQLKTL
jgi:hypothetical protein